MDCIFKAREHVDNAWLIAEKLGVLATDKNKFISSMLYTSMNHCDAIQVLVQQQNLASSSALLRPLFENTFRAVWLHNCASEEQSLKVMNSKDGWPSPWNAIQLIEAQSDNPKLLSKLWEIMRENMHDFTHGGRELAYRQIGGNIITSNISYSEVFELMKIVVLFSSYVLSQLIELSEDKDAILLLEDLLDNQPF